MKHIKLAVYFFVLFATISPFANAQSPTNTKAYDNYKDIFPAKSWTVIGDPEKTGWSTEKFTIARQYADSIGSACVMIIHHGVVIYQWGDTKHKYNSYSIRKSLISALYGIYVAKGVIDTNATLEQLGVEDNEPSLTKKEKQARIIDLLRARSGVYHPVDFETQRMKDNRPARGSHPPGTFWFYNNWDFNALGTIFEKKVGSSIGKTFNERIAKEIGMEDYTSDDCYYIGGTVSRHPAFQFHISTRDLARFGLLYLRQGRWNNKQIIQADWVYKSTHTTDTVLNGAQRVGYGYLWWIDIDNQLYPGLTDKVLLFSARGLGEHAVIVIPDRDLVIVHRVANPDTPTSVVANMQNIVNPPQIGHLLQLILNAQKK